MTSPVNYNDILSAYSDYPSPIRPFLLYADTQGDIRSKLTKATRLAFLDLVARANIANPQQPIMVRVDHTAAKLGISEKSVSRTIRLMRKNGWIEPSKSHDGRNNNGEFAWKEYTFTPAFRALLRMPGASDSQGTQPSPPSGPTGAPSNSEHPAPSASHVQTVLHSPAQPSKRDATVQAPEGFTGVRKALDIVQRLANRQLGQQNANAAVTHSRAPIADKPEDILDQDEKNSAVEPELSSGHIYAVNKVFIKKEASLQNEALKREASFEKASNPNGQNPPKQARVPASLKDLCDLLDILPEGVCALMASAKQKGHWLQDVWTAKKETLLNSGAKGGRAVKYFEFLLNCGEDFSYVARTKISAMQTASTTRATTTQSTPTTTSTTAGSRASHPDAPQGSQVDADEALKEIAKAVRYKRFRHVSNPVRVRIYEGSAEVTNGVKQAIIGGWTQMKQIYRDIASGILVEVPQ
jgi:hypothetical protein